MRCDRSRSAAAVLSLLLLAAACGGGGGKASVPTSSGSSTSAASGDGKTGTNTATSAAATVAPTTTTLALRPGQTLHKVDATFEYGAFVVTVGDVVYDKPSKMVAIGLRFANIGESWGDLLAQGTLSDKGNESSIIYDTQTVPAHTSVETTVTAGPFDTDPTATGVLVWGRPDRDTPTIHLADGKVDGGWLPNSFPLDVWGSVGKYSVHGTSGEVDSGSLMYDIQSDPGERMLRLNFDEWAAVQDPVNGFYPTEHLTLIRPDGTEVTSEGSSDGIAPVSWTADAGQWIEFPVKASAAGTYQLVLTSLSTKGFSTFHPELLDKARIKLVVPPLTLRKAAPTTTPEPDLSKLPGAPAAKRPAAINLTIPARVLNVPGFAVTPKTFTWDPKTKTAKLTGTARVIEADDNAPAANAPASGASTTKSSTKGSTKATAPSTATTAPLSANGAVTAATSLLDAPPQFDFPVVLQSARHNHGGTITSEPTVERGVDAPLTIEFSDVDGLDPNDLSIVMGSAHSTPSTLPLTPGAAFALYPPEPRTGSVTAPTVTAGVWSIHVVSYRLGRLLSAPPPAPGQLDLELTMDVTIARDAPPKALGLSFRPSVQVFLARPDGYLGQATADGGLVEFTPGSTHRERVLFHVADSFSPATIGLVLRGGDETADVTSDVFPETTFRADLGGGSSVGGI